VYLLHYVLLCFRFQSATRDHVKWLVQQFDSDGDGKVSCKEFITALRKSDASRNQNRQQSQDNDADEVATGKNAILKAAKSSKGFPKQLTVQTDLDSDEGAVSVSKTAAQVTPAQAKPAAVANEKDQSTIDTAAKVLARRKGMAGFHPGTVVGPHGKDEGEITYEVRFEDEDGTGDDEVLEVVKSQHIRLVHPYSKKEQHGESRRNVGEHAKQQRVEVGSEEEGAVYDEYSRNTSPWNKNRKIAGRAARRSGASSAGASRRTRKVQNSSFDGSSGSSSSSEDKSSDSGGDGNAGKRNSKRPAKLRQQQTHDYSKLESGQRELEESPGGRCECKIWIALCTKVAGLVITSTMLSSWGVCAVVVYALYKDKPCAHDLAIWALAQGVALIVAVNWQLYATITHRPAHLNKSAHALSRARYV